MGADAALVIRLSVIILAVKNALLGARVNILQRPLCRSLNAFVGPFHGGIMRFGIW